MQIRRLRIDKQKPGHDLAFGMTLLQQGFHHRKLLPRKLFRRHPGRGQRPVRFLYRQQPDLRARRQRQPGLAGVGDRQVAGRRLAEERGAAPVGGRLSGTPRCAAQAAAAAPGAAERPRRRARRAVSPAAPAPAGAGRSAGHGDHQQPPRRGQDPVQRQPGARLCRGRGSQGGARRYPPELGAAVVDARRAGGRPGGRPRGPRPAQRLARGLAVLAEPLPGAGLGARRQGAAHGDPQLTGVCRPHRRPA